MTASLATLTKVITATRPHRTGIAPDEHHALIQDLAPALVEAIGSALLNVFVDATDDHGDPWSVLICVDFVDARDFGPVVLRYGVPESDRETCRKAHGGFDDRMARVTLAEDAFYHTAFHPPWDVATAILDAAHDEAVKVGRETLQHRAHRTEQKASAQGDGGVA